MMWSGILWIWMTRITKRCQSWRMSWLLIKLIRLLFLRLILFTSFSLSASLFFLTETVMDTRTATAELGWISFPANGVRTMCIGVQCVCVCVCVCVCSCGHLWGKQLDYVLLWSINESFKILITLASWHQLTTIDAEKNAFQKNHRSVARRTWNSRMKLNRAEENRLFHPLFLDSFGVFKIPAWQLAGHGGLPGECVWGERL